MNTYYLPSFTMRTLKWHLKTLHCWNTLKIGTISHSNQTDSNLLVGEGATQFVLENLKSFASMSSSTVQREKQKLFVKNNYVIVLNPVFVENDNKQLFIIFCTKLYYSKSPFLLIVGDLFPLQSAKKACKRFFQENWTCWFGSSVKKLIKFILDPKTWVILLR